VDVTVLMDCHTQIIAQVGVRNFLRLFLKDIASSVSVFLLSTEKVDFSILSGTE
jgi:hypothetical protein